MKQKLIDLLKDEFKYPVKQQGSMSENETYPDHFFTIWNNDVPEGSHYDNKPVSFIWDFDVNFYSIDPEKVNKIMLEVRVLLTANGFVVNGKGYDVASDEPTHTGVGINVFYVEREV